MEGQLVRADRALMRLALEMAWAIDTCDETALDPDIAVQWMEDITAALAGLPSDAREGLKNVAQELAEETRSVGRSAEATFYERAADDLGFG